MTVCASTSFWRGRGPLPRLPALVHKLVTVICNKYDCVCLGLFLPSLAADHQLLPWPKVFSGEWLYAELYAEGKLAKTASFFTSKVHFIHRSHTL